MYSEGFAVNDWVILPTIYKEFVLKVVMFIRNNFGDKEQGRNIVPETKK